ncbi:uncharacterized protein STEHIDRAFT_121396 [Stereum hirsutum FP-91666 SS1]|uniref:uncharacterized protein n=1 Tax=Stereum hirsutum (strain FP-91666) TaxID=721885 RepID=UPI000440B7E5|nr:uncharacterized protein STEHIDRAFT_121396 [Stereum hirsutum FP-91666 SS1]EIM86451.1 hypothetical protein STEHIDRAFT_121396 [Stereum hirsutum FP-91666 SS1]
MEGALQNSRELKDVVNGERSFRASFGESRGERGRWSPSSKRIPWGSGRGSSQLRPS